MKQRLLWAWVLFAAIGCKQGEGDGAGTATGAPAPSGSAGVASECDQYAAKLCEKAGSDAPECQAMRELAGVMAPAGCTAALKDFAYTEGKLATKRKPCDELMTRLCKDLGEGSESCKMVRERTPSFPGTQCQAMLQQYSAVLGELQRGEARLKPLDDAARKKLVEGARATHGSPAAKVEIVAFSDFQCPYCSRASAAMDAIKKKFGDKVYVVFRQFPLDFHKEAHLAAQASLAANEQGKFWEFHDKVFQNQRDLEREDLEKYAREIGLDMAKFKKALDDGAYKTVVDEDLALGKSVNVDGTPTAFINGRRMPEIAETSAALAMVEAELAKN